MIEEPMAHTISRATGVLGDASGAYEKRLADLEGVYADAAAFAAMDGGRVVYRVEDVRPAVAPGGLIFGTTMMEPGRVGDEFFLTRGHLHALPDRPETYRGESGRGVMLLESPEGETRTLEIGPDILVYVPPFWIHRSVNIGRTPLVMSFAYPADSGQDYDIIERAGGMAQRVVAASDDGWRMIPNTAYRPRTRTEIDAVYECERNAA